MICGFSYMAGVLTVIGTGFGLAYKDITRKSKVKKEVKKLSNQFKSRLKLQMERKK
jgi:hypothetical protein